MTQANESNKLENLNNDMSIKDDADIRRAEYENLYKEISDNSDRIYRILNICIPATAAFLGFPFLTLLFTSKFDVNNNVLLFLPFLLLTLPFSIILPSILFIISLLNSTVRIATYIETFYEKGYKDILWQTRMQKIRKGEGGRKEGGLLQKGKRLLETSRSGRLYLSGRSSSESDKMFRGLKRSLQGIFLTLGFACTIISFLPWLYISKWGSVSSIVLSVTLITIHIVLSRILIGLLAAFSSNLEYKWSYENFEEFSKLWKVKS